MKRSDFVKSILTLTGTGFIYGCESINEDTLMSLDTSPSDLSVINSQKWFRETYIPRYQSTSGHIAAGSSVDRDFDWSKGVKVKINNEEFVWVPVQYRNSNELPTLITWNDGQEYIPKLAKFLKWFIAEGFMVYQNKKGEYEGFLTQVAYDPFKHKPGTVIDENHYTGMIIHAELNENPLRGWRYLDGKSNGSFDASKGKNSRMAQCYPINYSYQTVTVQSCGPNCTEANYVLHQNVYTYCDDPSSGGSGSGGGYPYSSGGGGSPTVTPPISQGFSPYVQYDFNKVGRQQGQDYQVFMQRLDTALKALSISQIPLSQAADYTESALKTLGLGDAVITGSVTVSRVSSVLGVAGVAIAGTQLLVGWSDGDISQNDLLSAAGFLLGVIAVTSNPVGWIAMTTAAVAGTLSVGITIYTTNHP